MTSSSRLAILKIAAFGLYLGMMMPSVIQAAETPPAEMLKLRDPFKRPNIRNDGGVKRTELEMVDIDKMKVMGVVTGPKNMRAMLSTPDGKTHFVSEGMKIGTHQGVITKIAPTSLRVREKIVNVLGQEESVETDILLPADSRGGAQGKGP